MPDSTHNRSRLPPVIPPPRPLSPMSMDFPEWESYRSPPEGGIGLKRPRNPRARSPPEAPPRKGPRTGSAPPMDSGSPDGARDGGGVSEGENATENGNTTEGGHHGDVGQRVGALDVGFGVKTPSSPKIVVGTTSHVSVC